MEGKRKAYAERLPWWEAWRRCEGRLPMTPYPYKDAAVSFHEAGHAVAAWLLGRYIESVSIVPDAYALGHAIHSDGENSLFDPRELSPSPDALGGFRVVTGKHSTRSLTKLEA